MTGHPSIDAIRATCSSFPDGVKNAEAAALERQSMLTKPPGSLGRLERIAAFLAGWQGRAVPKLDNVSVLVFAGSHGVTAQGVSAFPA